MTDGADIAVGLTDAVVYLSGDSTQLGIKQVEELFFVGIGFVLVARYLHLQFGKHGTGKERSTRLL